MVGKGSGERERERRLARGGLPGHGARCVALKNRLGELKATVLSSRGYAATQINMARPQHRHTIEFAELDPVKFYTIGPALLLGVRVMTYPAALVKTRLQAQRYTAAASRVNATNTRPPKVTVMREMSRGQYSGTWDAFRSIARTEGISALYKGFASKAFGLFATMFTSHAMRGCVAA